MSPAQTEQDPQTVRLRLFDAVSGVLTRAAQRRPLLVVIDDLHWADASSVLLLDFLARTRRPARLVVVAAYRETELPPDHPVAMLIDELRPRTDIVGLDGLDTAAVGPLMAGLVGYEPAADAVSTVTRRTGGNPFFVRELTRQLAHLGDLRTKAYQGSAGIPAGVRGVVERRLARLPEPTVALLALAAVAGNDVEPDVLLRAGDLTAGQISSHLATATAADVLVRRVGGLRFTHDLFRETIYDGLPPGTRAQLHKAVGDALTARADAGFDVPASRLAQHYAASVSVCGAAPAIAHGRAAAAAARDRLAYTEAVASLERALAVVAESGVELSAADRAEVLLDLANAHVRAGQLAAAREVADRVVRLARELGDAQRLAHAVLILQRLGVRQGMPREELVDLLEESRCALSGTDSGLAAMVTAGLARELYHSLATPGGRVESLSADALAIARRVADPATLGSCLLARHDAIWRPGFAAERLALSTELGVLARHQGDRESLAEAMLLRATALGELGNPAFRQELTSYLDVAATLRQPRLEYVATSRRATLALLDGQLPAADRLIEEATRLADAIGEPDQDNVRLTQRMELARASGDPELLRTVADEARTRWTTGMASYAQAEAAVLLAHAGDIDEARSALAAAAAPRDWRVQGDYLWAIRASVLAQAAAIVGDRQLCAELLDALRPHVQTCVVVAASVRFGGSLAYPAGVAAAALDQIDLSIELLDRSLSQHEALGAQVYAATSRAELGGMLLRRDGDGDRARGSALLARALEQAAELGLGWVARRASELAAAADTPAGEHPGVPEPVVGRQAVLRRDGDTWEVGYAGRTARLRDAKGLHDLAALLRRPMDLIPAATLAAGPLHAPGPTTLGADHRLDATAATAYRRRIHEITTALADAQDDHDLVRAEQLADERDTLTRELAGAFGLGRRPRRLGDTAERARKAVSARIRDSIGRIAAVDADLGVHLDRSIETGTTCRYRPVEPMDWTL